MADKAHNGSEAIKKCKAFRYDLVFMDIEMPNMDGYDTTRSIRKIRGGSSSSHIIALSGTMQTPLEVELCQESGMNDCIVKPINPKVLQKKLWGWRKALAEK